MYIVPLKKVFKVKGVAVDPLNRGFTVYMSLKVLQELLHLNDVNLILLKVKNEEVIKEVKEVAGQFNLSANTLNRIVSGYLDAFYKLWTCFDIPVAFIVISSLIFLAAYLSLTTIGKKMTFALCIPWSKAEKDSKYSSWRTHDPAY